MPVRSLGRRSLVFTSLSVAGCGSGSFLPQSGPPRDAVVNGASILVGDVGQQQKLPYALVRVSAPVLSDLENVDRPAGFSPQMVQAAKIPNSAIGVGDFVAITVFEAGAGGLFIPSEPGTRSGNFINLPTQQVDASGSITVPFAGTVKVAGMSPQAVSRTLTSRLGDRALEPQVVVTITDRRANAVSVTGDVNTSARFILDPGGERLLGAIARAGGPKFPPYESVVTLQRGGVTEHSLVSDIIRDPAQNVPLAGNDTILVSREPRYFLALGALGPGQYLGLVNRRLSFEDSKLSLADAVAKVGGLSDDRANARAVFIYRYEKRERLRNMGVITTADASAVTAGSLPATIPTIYYLDLVEPSGYFYAGSFPMSSEDLIFVSNSPSTDLAKFLALILPTAYSAANFRAL